ncbi:MAG: nuclear transport factor 2 family protein, partial [Thermocrispum sp.]
MPELPVHVADTYFTSWRGKDFDALRSVLAADVTFSGPLAELQGAEACRAGLERMSEIVTDIEVIKRFVDGEDVLTWFKLHTSVAPPLPTANWSRVRDGKI